MRAIRGRQIGAIFQDPLTTLNPLYTVGRQLVETMPTHLTCSTAARRAKRAVELLEDVGIPARRAQRIDSYPHQFSGGMRQRVVIALALCAEPRLIVADEPTTALDVSIQAQIIALLKRLVPRAGHGDDAGDPRHGRHRRDRRPRRGDVCRPHRRDRPGAGGRAAPRSTPTRSGLMGSIPPLGHRRASGCAQIEGAMPRLNAIPPRLRLQPALPAASSTAAASSGRTCCRRAQTRAACWLYDADGEQRALEAAADA